MPQEAGTKPRLFTGIKRAAATLGGAVGVSLDKTPDQQPNVAKAQTISPDAPAPVVVPVTTIDMGAAGARSATASEGQGGPTVPEASQLSQPAVGASQGQPASPDAQQGSPAASGPVNWVESNTLPDHTLESDNEVQTADPTPGAFGQEFKAPPATVEPVDPDEVVIVPAAPAPASPDVSQGQPAVPPPAEAEPASSYNNDNVAARTRTGTDLPPSDAPETVQSTGPAIPEPPMPEPQPAAETQTNRKKDGIATLVFNQNRAKYLELGTDGKMHLNKSLLRQDAKDYLANHISELVQENPDLAQEFEEEGIELPEAA